MTSHAPEPDLTLAERLLLLTLDDEKGVDRTGWGAELDGGLAGAILLDLAAAGCIREQGGRLVAVDCTPPEDRLAVAALDAIRGSSKQREAKDWVAQIAGELKPLRERSAEALVSRGVLGEETRRRFGLVRRTRYPERDPEPERRLRAALAEVLLAEREPEDREAMLIALLANYDVVKELVPKERRRAAKERAREITERAPLAAAIADAVRDAHAAYTAAAGGGGGAAAAGAVGGG